MEHHATPSSGPQLVTQTLRTGDYYLIQIAIGHWFLRRVLLQGNGLAHTLVAQDPNYDKMRARGDDDAKLNGTRLLKHLFTQFKNREAHSTYEVLADYSAPSA